MNFIKKSKRFIGKNSSIILTGIGTVGVILTAVLAAKATPKALKILEEKKNESDEISKIDTAIIMAPAYIPSILMGASTIACIWSATIISTKRQAALTSAYALLNTSYQDYKKKLIELYGKEADEKIRTSIALDHLKDAPELAHCEHCLFLDELSNTFFEASMMEVQDAEYQLNRKLAVKGHVSVNDFYNLLGLDYIPEFGEEFGWSFESLYDDVSHCWIDFEHLLVTAEDSNDPDYRCFYSLSMPIPPTTNYMDIW